MVTRLSVAIFGVKCKCIGVLKRGEKTVEVGCWATSCPKSAFLSLQPNWSTFYYGKEEQRTSENEREEELYGGNWAFPPHHPSLHCCSFTAGHSSGQSCQLLHNRLELDKKCIRSLTALILWLDSVQSIKSNGLKDSIGHSIWHPWNCCCLSLLLSVDVYTFVESRSQRRGPKRRLLA